RSRRAMRRRRWLRRCGCWAIPPGGRKWPLRESGYAKRTAARPRATWLSADRYCQRAVDLFEVLLAQRAGGGLEAQVVEDGVVAREREVALGRVELLLGVQHVDVDPDADLVAELVRVERALRRHLRLLERRDLRDAVQRRQVELARGE